MKAHIMIGMVGSGKSSWAKMTARTDFNTIRVGVDDIRSMIKDRYTFDFQLEPLVQQLKYALIVQVLLAGKDIVIDDCHLTRDERSKLCVILHKTVADIEITYVWMKCDDGVSLERRLTNLRGGSEFEWQQVIKKHRSMFEPPANGENIYTFDIVEVDNNE